MADGLEITCETKRKVKDNTKIFSFFWPEQLINMVMGEYQSRNIFEKIEEELSSVWDIITLMYLLVIQVQFLGRQLYVKSEDTIHELDIRAGGIYRNAWHLNP